MVGIMSEVWPTAAEAAQYLRVKPRTLLLWVRQGKVPAYDFQVISAAALAIVAGKHLLRAHYRTAR
jgi:hypothetical protein